jgi:acetoacetyl-CoA synthetase
MAKVNQGDMLWTPNVHRLEKAHLTQYSRWLAAHGRYFQSYADLWQWSIDDQEGFWGSLWEYFEVRPSQPYERVIGSRTMPGADWFPGTRLNYAEHALLNEREGADALVYLSEHRALSVLSWTDLGNMVRKLATCLRTLGVAPGDRVVAYLPNSPEAVIAMLATASIGAIWASCGPDFGPLGVVDRFLQLEPKIIICVDGYYYGGKPFDRRLELKIILNSLPSLEQVIYVRQLEPTNDALTARTLFWEDALAGPDVSRESFRFEQVPFAHPLWILFSSGTTGSPKPIIHCHGGMILEQIKGLKFHMDVHPGERMFFFTTTGWMMWNLLVSALLVDVVPVLYDGNPAYPEPDVLWAMVERAGVSFFGASPTYVSILEKAGIVPKDRFDLSRLKSVMLAGSPVTAECSPISGPTPLAAAPIYARASSAASSFNRFMPGKFRVGNLEWRRTRSMIRGSRSSTRSASWSSPSPRPRCPSASGTMPTARVIENPISINIPVCGDTAISSRLTSAAVASYWAAPTRP